MRAGNRGGVRHKGDKRDRFGGVRLLGLRAPLAEGAQTTIGVKNHFALKALEEGTASGGHMARLAHALNMSLVLCELNIGPQYLTRVQAAQSALVACAERSRTAGYWHVHGAEREAIRSGFEIHDAQLARASLTEIAAAEDEIHRRAVRGDVIAAPSVS